jgi:hypothetical protein
MNRTGGRQLRGRRPYARRRASRRPRVDSSLIVSVVSHLIVLAALVRFAGLAAAAPIRFDVFAADAVEATPEVIVVRAPAPGPVVSASRQARPTQPAARSIVRTPAAVSTPSRAVARDPVAVQMPSVEPIASASTPAAGGLAVAAVAPAGDATLSERPEVTMAPGPETSGPLAAEAEAAGADEAVARSERPQLPVLATPLQPVTRMPFPAMPGTMEPIAVERASVTARPTVATLAPPRPTPAGSALGLGLGRLRIRLDGARSRTTDQETDVISGMLIGGAAARLVVQVDDRTSESTLDGRAFTASVKLLPGLNRVRVLATDTQGAEVEEVVTVDYAPPVTADVALVSPRDGHMLSSDDPPLVEVQGQVNDANLTAVWVVSNDRRVMVPVVAGRFRHVVPVFEPEMRIRAETGIDRRGSMAVTVHGAAALPAIGLSLIDWPRVAAGPPQMTVTWRPNPAQLEGGARSLSLRGIGTDAGPAGADFFYLRDARPGVYTFSLSYRAGAATAVRPILYLGGAQRSLQPIALDGTGRVVIARLLLPQGVLWEQEDWFTGRSASGDTVTKFRFPEGVSWTERPGDVR